MSQHFRYRARDQKGDLVTGAIAARSPREVVKTLLAQKIYPSSVKKTTFRIAAIFPKPERDSTFLSLEKRIGFYLKFATLLKAGITIREALTGLSERAESTVEKEAINRFLACVEEGKSLSTSMQSHIPQVETSVIAASESAGALDEGLHRLAANLERKLAFIRLSSDVFRYPMIVVCALGIALVLLTSFVIPRYAAIFERTDMPLPFPTRALLFIDKIIGEQIIAIFTVTLLLATIALMWAKTRKGREWVDKVLIKTPVAGEIILFLSLARWADALSSLIASGVGIIEAVYVAGGALGNQYLAKPLSKNITARLSEGDGLSVSLAESGAAPATLVQMVEVGERAGQLPETLSLVGKYYGDEATRRAKRVAALIEPALIATLGLIVLFMALAIFMPMWEMTRFVGR